MRNLDFIVDGQYLSPDANCDFTGLVPGTEGYLSARFKFSPEWDGCVKVAEFYSSMGHEYEPQILKDGFTCLIPVEALKNQIFKIRLIGKKDGFRITTNKVIVHQNGGRI